MGTLEPKDYILGAGVLVTLILGVWNAINNARLSKRTSFINTVTSERVKWIDKLRQNISAYCGLTHMWCYSRLEGKPEEGEILKEIDKLRYLIRLQLNPNDPLGKEIENLIAKMPDLTHETQRDELKKAFNELVEKTQQLLKAEWEKVKAEAEHGNLKA